jgi:glyoxylase-like metal-dependent hydrolase (beta-lactamase superfamily II)
MPEWKWVHTPGHTFGHISLYRERDGVLLAGDALSSTDISSAISVMSQKKKLCGPPAFLTPDWGASARSVKALAALQPQVIATGHGPSLYGPQTRKSLNKLARQFWDLGMPSSGRYLREPALANEEGITYIPPARYNYKMIATIGLTLVAAAAAVVYLAKRQSKSY